MKIKKKCHKMRFLDREKETLIWALGPHWVQQLGPGSRRRWQERRWGECSPHRESVRRSKGSRYSLRAAVRPWSLSRCTSPGSSPPQSAPEGKVLFLCAFFWRIEFVNCFDRKARAIMQSESYTNTRHLIKYFQGEADKSVWGTSTELNEK